MKQSRDEFEKYMRKRLSRIHSRCNNSKPNYKKAYMDCSVCHDWLFFDRFYKWAKDNYYEVDGQVMCIDKDLMVEGNTVYSPETCCFLPNDINVALMYSRNNNTNKAYIRRKTRHLKELANKYKDQLPEKVYNRLMEFDFEKAIKIRNDSE